MAYVRTTWENKKTRLNATNMNNIETGIAESKEVASTASTTAQEAKVLANLKQEKLVSGTNIKTINNESLLGSGDISISGGLEFDDLALYTKYGVFRVNGTAYDPETTSEIVLTVGSVYELSGYLKNGHIIINATDPELSAADTQLIFNNVFIKSDDVQAIYSNQTKKKIAITLLKDTDNAVYAGTGTCSEEDSEGVIQADGNMFIVSDTGSKLFVSTTNANQHAIKGSRLCMSGEGTITVTAKHDGFHGGKLLRIESGNYRVTKAEVDGFEAKLLQVLGGNIQVDLCYGDALSSKESAGTVAGYSAKFTFGSTIAQANYFNNIDVLETAPAITGVTSVTLEDHYGTFIIKESSTKPADDFPTETELASWTTVSLASNKYTTSKQYVYIEGYCDNQLVATVAKTKLFIKNACLYSGGEDAALVYVPTTNKCELKAAEDSINYFINAGSGNAVESNSSVGVQEDGNYIFKAISGCAINNINYLFTKGDGVKQFISDNIAINAARFTIGADHADIVEDLKADMFEAGSVLVTGTIKLSANSVDYCDGKLYYAYGQIGAVEVADFNVAGVVKFWKGTLTVIQTEKSAVIIKTKDDTVVTDAYTKAESDEKYALKSEVAALTKKVKLLEDMLAGTLYPTYPKLTYSAAGLNPVVVRGKDGVVADYIWTNGSETYSYNKDGSGYIAAGDDAQFNIIVDCPTGSSLVVTPTYSGDKPYNKLETSDYEESGTVVAEKKRIKATKVTGSFEVSITIA